MTKQAPLPEVEAFLARLRPLRIGGAEGDATVAGSWSQDATRVCRFAHRLPPGAIWRNCRGDTDAASALGGMKHPGYGRDMGKDAIAPDSQKKGVWLA